MASSREPDTLPMLEMSCPEYYATHIGRIEQAGGGNLRVWCCVRRGNALEPVYTVVIPAALLAQTARLCMHAAAEAHNEMTFKDTH